MTTIDPQGVANAFSVAQRATPTTIQTQTKDESETVCDPSDIHPARRREIEAYLDKRYVKWVFDPEVAVEEFDDQSSLRNQARFVAIEPKVVENYAAAMERGDEFPAVIATRQGTKLKMVDGNHRYHSRVRARLNTIPAYIISASPETIEILTYEANTKHGLPTSQDERQRHAIWLIDHGATHDSAAAITGLTRANVSRAWRKEKVERRARTLGIRRGWDKLNTSVKTRLDTITTDAGFKAAALYAIDAQLTTMQVDSMVDEMAKTRSEEQQVRIVQEQVETHRAAIQSGGAGILRAKRGPQRSTPRVMFLAHLGYIRSINMDDLISNTTLSERQSLAAQAYEVADLLLNVATVLEKSS